MAGCHYIVHVASPIPGNKELKDDEMIKPAKEGMLSILRAAQLQKVKRLVVTSSFSTIVGDVWKKKTGDSMYSEKDFAPDTCADGYARSKIAQERVIREFLKEQDETQAEYKLEVVTIHPTWVLGPTLINEENSSIAAIAKFMNGKVPGVPNIMLPCVDIRDVAEAHWRALFKEGINGERILVSNESLKMIEIC